MTRVKHHRPLASSESPKIEGSEIDNRREACSCLYVKNVEEKRIGGRRRPAKSWCGVVLQRAKLLLITNAFRKLNRAEGPKTQSAAGMPASSRGECFREAARHEGLLREIEGAALWRAAIKEAWRLLYKCLVVLYHRA